MSRLVPILCLFSCAISGLHAHDLYVMPDTFFVAPKTRLLVGFHNGDSFPESEDAPTLARLKDAQLRSASATVAVHDLKLDGKRAVGAIEAPEGIGDLILSVHTVPKFIELAPENFLGYLKEEGLTKVVDWRAEHGEANKPGRERYSKFAKSLVVSGTPDDFYRQSIGFPLEIVPESDPYRVHPGAELPVRVVFRGKPAAGLQLEAAWSGNGQGKTTVIVRTDADGRIRVPLSAAGKWRLHSLMMERCVEPAAADWESFWRGLSIPASAPPKCPG